MIRLRYKYSPRVEREEEAFGWLLEASDNDSMTLRATKAECYLTVVVPAMNEKVICKHPIISLQSCCRFDCPPCLMNA